MKSQVVMEKCHPGLYKVSYSNGVPLGEFVQDVDGCFYLWFELGKDGAWTWTVLREIADLLEKLNANL